MKKAITKIFIIFTLIFGVFLVIPSEVYAQVTQEKAAIFAGVTEACWEKGSCTLCDIMVVFINVADGILRVFAILALVFFVYGAGHLVLSSGKEDMVTKGKGIIKATIVGSIVVLVAWQLMNFIVLVVVNESVFKDDPELRVDFSITAWYNVAGRCEGIAEVTDDFDFGSI